MIWSVRRRPNVVVQSFLRIKIRHQTTRSMSQIIAQFAAKFLYLSQTRPPAHLPSTEHRGALLRSSVKQTKLAHPVSTHPRVRLPLGNLLRIVGIGRASCWRRGGLQRVERIIFLGRAGTTGSASDREACVVSMSIHGLLSTCGGVRLSSVVTGRDLVVGGRRIGFH